MWNWYRYWEMLRLALGSLTFTGFISLAACSSDGGSPSNSAGTASATAGASNTAGAANGGAGGSGHTGGSANAGSGNAGASDAGSGNAGASSAGASNGGANNGGSAGSAGGAPAGGAGAGTAGSGAAGGPSGCALCDDFEGVAAGMPPDPTKWTSTVLSDCVSNAAKPLVDASQHHSGAQSLKVAGTASYCDSRHGRQLIAFKALGNIVYGRYYVRFETALPAGHTAFVDLSRHGHQVTACGRAKLRAAVEPSIGRRDAALAEPGRNCAQQGATGRNLDVPRVHGRPSEGSNQHLGRWHADRGPGRRRHAHSGRRHGLGFGLQTDADGRRISAGKTTVPVR